MLKAFRGIAALGCGVFLVVALWAHWTAHWSPVYGTYHDDGVTLATAKSLAEGHGYRVEGLPRSIPQTKYPPLFPALLAVAWTAWPVFPANLPLLKLVPFLGLLAWLWATFAFVRREGESALVAAAVCALASVTSWVVFVGHTLLSETVFAALLTGSLYYARRVEDWRPEDGRVDRAALVLAALVAGAAFYARTAALPLVAAIGLAWVKRGRWRETATFLGIVGVVVAPWVLWSAAQPPVTDALEAYYSKENYLVAGNVITAFTLPQKLDILYQNFVMLLPGPGQMVDLPPSLDEFRPFSYLFGAFVLVGAWRCGVTSFTLFLALYLVQLTLWGWPPERFLVPLVPVFLWLAWRGAAGRYQWVRVAGAVALAVNLIVPRFVDNVNTYRRGDRTPVTIFEPGRWEQIEQSMAWVRANTPPDAVIATDMDPLVYLATGRRGIRPFAYDPVGFRYQRNQSPPVPLADTLARLDHHGVTHILARRWPPVQEVEFVRELARLVLEKAPESARFREIGLPDYAVVELDAAKALQRVSGPPAAR